MNAPVAKTCRQRCPFARFASICALVACALLLLPAVAGADGYSMTQTYISATVEADGSLTVVEGRQFDFDDDINGVFWEINTGTNQQGGTAGVDVLSVEEEDTAFNKVDSANKGDSGVYTVEQTGDGVRIKVFSPHESGDSAIYYVSYTMTGAVMNWADTAELYWKFVGDGWSADSDDVEMEVCFANAAAGTAAVKGDNFRAWGHGPLTGDVSLDEDEPMVTYTIPCVHQGEFAEARIAFPSDWVPQLAASGEDRMSTILSEEKEWADEANARREHARAVAGAIAVACVVVAVAYTGVIVMLKLRRPKPKPLFQDEYFRDVPSADHPAVLAALMSWNGVPDQAYIATLMKLTDDRVIKLEEATETKKKGLLRREKEEQTYRITVTDEAWKAAKKDGIDRDVLKVFFAGVKPDKDGVRSRTFSELEEYASERTESVGDKLEDYQSTVKGKLEEREFIASDGTIVMVAGLVLGIIIVFGILGSLFYTDFGRQRRCRCDFDPRHDRGLCPELHLPPLHAGGRRGGGSLQGAQALARGFHTPKGSRPGRSGAVEQAAGDGRCPRRFERSAATAGRGRACGPAQQRRFLRQLPLLLVVLPSLRQRVSARFVQRCVSRDHPRVGFELR